MVIVFGSFDNQLVAGDTNDTRDIFLRNMGASTMTRVSVNHLGNQLSLPSYGGGITADARRVMFHTNSATVVPGDTNGTSDTFVLDRQTDEVERISIASGGFQANGASTRALLSLDGASRFFESSATNLVASDTNGAPDVFVGVSSGSAFFVYCFGDGTATPCPCGNESAAGLELGCLNSSGQGASLRATGVPRTSNDDVILLGSGMPNGPCLYFQGTVQFNSGLGVVFGDGLRCSGGSVIRLGVSMNVGGASQYPSGSDPSVSIQGQCLPGHVRTYQTWYRDAQSFCAPETYNLSNGLTFVWRL